MTSSRSLPLNQATAAGSTWSFDSPVFDPSWSSCALLPTEQSFSPARPTLLGSPIESSKRWLAWDTYRGYVGGQPTARGACIAFRA